MALVATVGEMVPATRFACVQKHHRQLDEVRLESVGEVVDRRFRDGVRIVQHFFGYCACCGRRVEVEPA